MMFFYKKEQTLNDYIELLNSADPTSLTKLLETLKAIAVTIKQQHHNKYAKLTLNLEKVKIQKKAETPLIAGDKISKITKMPQLIMQDLESFRALISVAVERCPYKAPSYIYDKIITSILAPETVPELDKIIECLMQAIELSHFISVNSSVDTLASASGSVERAIPLLSPTAARSGSTTPQRTTSQRFFYNPNDQDLRRSIEFMTDAERNELEILTKEYNSRSRRSSIS